MTYREVLFCLAQRLPSAALGFQNLGGDRAMTVAEFQGQPATGFASFSGTLTEHLLPEDAFALVRQLLKCPPQAIRSTAFTLFVKNVEWKGAPARSNGSLHVLDLKAFKRAERFSVSASVEVPGDDPKSPAVREALKQVAQATGLHFDTGRAARTRPVQENTPGRAEALLAAQICFEEAMENVAAQLPGRWVSEFAPNALPPGDAFRQRFEKYAEGAGGKVDLRAAIKRAVKKLLPELKWETANGDQILFTRPLGLQSELLVRFVKQLGGGGKGVGKAFSLTVGVRSLADGTRFTTDVFRLDRTSENRTWIYSDASEAEAVVGEAANLLKELLPRLESAFRQYFETWPKELPAGIPRNGPLTAREAFEKAEPIALKMYPDAVLIRLMSNPRSLEVRDIEGPGLTAEGRLTPNETWGFHFYSAARDASFGVTVPALGRIQVLDHGKQYQEEHTRCYLVPVGREWIDSDRAMALAEERGGRERRNSGRTFGISAKLQMSPSQQAYWGVMYCVVDKRGRNDLIVHINAVTGEELSGIRGF
jgi:hypothetical protein